MKVIYFLLFFLFFNSTTGVAPKGEIYENVVRCMSGVHYNHKELIDEIISWKNKSFIDTFNEITKLRDIKRVIDKGRHTSIARIIILKSGDKYEIKNFPMIFLSGLVSKFEYNFDDPLNQYIACIDTFNFLGSSLQTFAHSERAVILAASSEIQKCNGDEVLDIVIQIKNQKRMCEYCEQFFRGIGVYFVSVDEGGCFVGKEYKTKYDKSITNEDRKEFISEYKEILGLVKDIAAKRPPEYTVSDELWEKIRPKTIKDLVPVGTTIIESMDDGVLSEFVKITIQE